MKVNMHEAKSQLSKLGELAWKGEEIIIAKAGKPYLSLTPYKKKSKDRTPGSLKGKIWISPDFNDPDPEIEKLFYGEAGEDTSGKKK